MRRSLFIGSVLLIAVTTACSKHEEEKPTDVIPPYQQKALQQANDVGNVLKDADEKRRREMESQEPQ